MYLLDYPKAFDTDYGVCLYYIQYWCQQDFLHNFAVTHSNVTAYIFTSVNDFGRLRKRYAFSFWNLQKMPAVIRFF